MRRARLACTELVECALSSVNWQQLTPYQQLIGHLCTHALTSRKAHRAELIAHRIVAGLLGHKGPQRTTGDQTIGPQDPQETIVLQAKEIFVPLLNACLLQSESLTLGVDRNEIKAPFVTINLTPFVTIF